MLRGSPILPHGTPPPPITYNRPLGVPPPLSRHSPPWGPGPRPGRRAPVGAGREQGAGPCKGGRGGMRLSAPTQPALSGFWAIWSGLGLSRKPLLNCSLNSPDTSLQSYGEVGSPPPWDPRMGWESSSRGMRSLEAHSGCWGSGAPPSLLLPAPAREGRT